MAEPKGARKGRAGGGGPRTGTHHPKTPGWHFQSPVAEYSACQSGLKGEDVVIVREARPVVEGGPSWSLYCICDGHGGTAAANYVKAQLWRVLGPLLPRGVAPDCEDCEGFEEFACRVRAAVVKTFVKIDEKYAKEDSAIKSGTAVTLALLCGRLLTVANVGDADAVLDTGLESYMVTVNDRIETNEDERERLGRAGVRLAPVAASHWGTRPARPREDSVGPLRCWPGGLTISRSVGDTGAGNHILSTPHINQLMLPRSGTRLLMGSRGLWDLIRWEDALTSLRRVPTKHAASRAIELAMVQNSWSVQQDTAAVAVDVLLPTYSDFPRIARAKAKWERAKKASGEGALCGVGLCLGLQGNKYAQAIARFRCDAPKTVAKPDGWEVWKTLQEPSIIDSCSSHLAVFAAVGGPSGAPPPRRQRWRAAGYSESSRTRGRGCGMPGGCACAPVSCFGDRDAARAQRTTASLMKNGLNRGKRKSPRSPSKNGATPRRRSSLKRLSQAVQRAAEGMEARRRQVRPDPADGVPGRAGVTLADTAASASTASPLGSAPGRRQCNKRSEAREGDWGDDSARFRRDERVLPEGKAVSAWQEFTATIEMPKPGAGGEDSMVLWYAVGGPQGTGPPGPGRVPSY